MFRQSATIVLDDSEILATRMDRAQVARESGDVMVVPAVRYTVRARRDLIDI